MKRSWTGAVVLLMALGAVDAAGAQDTYAYAVSVLGGAGGAFDANPDSGLSNTSFQLGFGMLIDERALLGVRAGRLRFEDPGIGSLATADLDYATVAGEYRFRQSWYDYGLFFGLGDYRLDGRRASGARESQTALGVTLGLTGDFRVVRWLSVVGEIAGHYIFLDQATTFGQAQVGVAFHF